MLYSADVLGAFLNIGDESPAVDSGASFDVSAWNDTDASDSGQREADSNPDQLAIVPVTPQPGAPLRLELVLIDSNVVAGQQLIDDLAADDNRQLLVFMIDKNADGIEQISDLLGQYANIDAVHIVSHGVDAAVQLGNSWLSAATLGLYAEQITGWGTALSAEADLLFYGCNLAAGADGRLLLVELARLTEADVAASEDFSGAETAGGDWDLEYQAGLIDTAVVFNAMPTPQWSGLLAGVDPYIEALETVDLDSDGYIDAVRITFSVAIQDSSVTANDFDVVGVGGESFSFNTNGDVADDNIIYITFADGVLGTEATPEVTYTSDGLTDPNVEDMVGNPLADTTAAWWNTDWQYRTRIDFNNAASASNLVDFQVLVTLTAAQIDYARTMDQGEDIRFVDADGSLLNYEIDTWNEAGTSTVWVKVPQINAASTTDHIYIYYGNTAAAAAPNAAAVWGNNYSAVWHMDEDPGPGGAGDIKDSAGVAHLTAAATMTPTDLVTGQIGGALDFDGIDDIVTNSALTSTVALTYEAWIKPTALVGKFNTVLEFGDDQPWFGLDKDGKLQVYRDKSNEKTTAALSLSTWNYVVATHDGTNLRLWINGVQDFAGTINISSTATGFRIGDSPTDDPFRGVIDEVRISDVVRSSDWIKAQYKSMNATFNSFGVAESLAADKAPPVLMTKSMADTSLKVGEVSTLSLVFSEAVTGFDNSDISLVNGTLSTVTSADGGITWVGTFTPADDIEDATNVITVGTSYTDLWVIPRRSAVVPTTLQ